MQLVRDGNKPPGESSFYSTFTGPAIYTEAKKYQKVEFKDIENNKVDIPKTATNGYVAMVQHYFASAWLLADGIKREPVHPQGGQQPVLGGHDHPPRQHRAGRHQDGDARLFAGPQEEKCWKSWPPAWNWSRTTAG
jgi:YidC/Oxa1 family membrane protein insertase